MIQLDSIVQLLETYKYALLFPISVVEGPIVAVIAGFLCSENFLSIPITFLVLMAGDMGGDTMYYSIGRFGGHAFLRKWGNFFGIKEDKVMKTEEHFKKHAVKTLLIGKTQALGGIILAAAGLGKMPFSRYMWINILGSIPKVALFMVLGYYFGQGYRLINTYLGITTAIITGIAILSIIAYFLYFRKRKENL